MSTNDLDEACINATAHYEVWDSVEGKYVGPYCPEDDEYFMNRWLVKNSLLYWAKLSIMEG